MNNIKSANNGKTAFSGFEVQQTLMVYDFPLLLVCRAPDGGKWIFKWCNHVSNTDIPDGGSSSDGDSDIWIAFKISDFRLHQFLENHLSLRELILMAEDDVLQYYANDIFEPTTRPEPVKPRFLPPSFLPSADIMLNGTADNFQLEVVPHEGFGIGFHLVFPHTIAQGKAPLSIIAPFQDVFQKYLAWSARNLAKEGISELASPLGHWTEISPILSSAGSYRIICSTGKLDQTKSHYLVQTCQSLKNFLESDNMGSASLVLKDILGENGFLYLQALLSAILEFDISVNVKWIDGNKREEYIVLTKKVADQLLPSVSKTAGMEGMDVTIRVRLSAEEAARLRREVNGQGGMQTLLLTLQRNLTDDNVLTLTPELIQRILRYGQHYGQGGFQGRLQGVVRALKRMGISLLGLR